MAKYSFEFKKKIVLEYLEGPNGYSYLTKKYNLKTNSQIRRWVAAYKEFGDEGLNSSLEYKSYSFEFKLHVVKLYLSTKVSYQELALSQGIKYPTMIRKWVQAYQVIGPDALRPKKKGRKTTLKQAELNKKNKKSSIDTSPEHVRELEDELQKLRLENAFLKELRRLRLEDEAKMRDAQESSTASEDSSN